MKNIQKIIAVTIIITIILSFTACNISHNTDLSTGSDTTAKTTESQTAIQTTNGITEELSNETEPLSQLVIMSSYDIMLYATGAGDDVDTITPRINKSIRSGRAGYSYKKEEMPDKKYIHNGEEIYLKYEQTTVPNTQDYEIDEYHLSAENLFVSISYIADTDNITFFYNPNAGENRNFISDVNPSSSKEEFIAYAKQILSQYTSIEGLDIRIETYFKKTPAVTYPDLMSNYYPGFIYLYDKDPNAVIEYTFWFYKSISGIERRDSMSITICNTGEIRSLNIQNTEDVIYEPFENIQLNNEEIKNIIEETFEDRMNKKNLISYEVIYIVAVDNFNSLYIIAEIRYLHIPEDYGYQMFSTMWYALKVAEIISTNDPVENQEE